MRADKIGDCGPVRYLMTGKRHKGDITLAMPGDLTRGEYSF
jgi:hypothetical protein